MAIVFVVCVLVVIVVTAAFAASSAKCPKCKRSGALTETGTTKQEHWYSLSRFEYRCENCGHVVWRLTSLKAAEGT